MKKITALFLALTVLAGTALVGNAYAFFTYSDDGTPVDAKHTSTNSYFGDENGNEYYRVYFFASPYYATKTEIETKMTTDEGEVTKTETLTNPLEIANHAQNPYNSKDPYSLISPELTGQNAKYANVEFSNGTKHYIIYKNKFLDKLDGSENALELYQKRDFTGYIRANPDMGIAEQTSTYVVLTVRGNLSAEQLGGIVAETVFKDKYGFGSEFIGWTYDKAATADRATYKTYTGTSGYTISKYTTKNGMSSGNTQGYGIGTGYEIGNFGCQGAIAQVTSTTSLNAIDKSEGGLVSHTIFQTPTKAGKGILVTPTVDGNLLIGPTSEICDKDDDATTLDGLDMTKATALKSTKKLNFRKIITSFAGLRSACNESDDFIIEMSKASPRALELIGIDSPGLSSSPAIAEYAVELLKNAGLELAENKSFDGHRVSCRHFERMSDEEKNALIAKEPAYGHIVCRCETVTAGEIIAAVRQNPPARTLDAVKRRTRSGMGRCQGGFCTPFITELLARAQGIDETEVTKFGGDSRLLFGRTK